MMTRSPRERHASTSAANLPRGTTLIATLMLAVAPLALAHPPVDPATIAEGHPTGHVADKSDLTWPPQPRGITGVRLMGDPGRAALAQDARRLQAEADERVALRRPDVVQALGARYERIGIEQASGKGADTGSRRLVYFSHDRRATIEISITGAGVGAVTTTPAVQYQPEITDQEIAQASALARAHFLGLGRERVARLQAFGILAYTPRGRGFYGTRVLYISFHADADAAPEYAAWVDLTRQRVLRIREEQP